MAIGGKIIGGIIGMILLDWSGLPAGALLGFLLGGVLGHIFVDRVTRAGTPAQVKTPLPIFNTEHSFITSCA